MSSASAIGTLSGIPGDIWSVVLNTIAFAGNNISDSDPLTSLPIVQGCIDTMQSALDALDIYVIYDFGYAAYKDLQVLLTYPLKITNETNAIVTARMNAFGDFLQYLSFNVIPTIHGNQEKLNVGQSMIDSLDVLSIWMSYDYGTPPAGLSSSNFISNVQAELDAWNSVVEALNNGINYSGATYDVALNMSYCCQLTLNLITDIGTISDVNINQSWQLLVSLPTVSALTSIYYNDVSSYLCQQLGIVRVTIQNAIKLFSQMLISLEESVLSNIQLGTVQNNKTIMDLAARKLGNYEDWQNIVAANGLLPPYIGDGTGLATAGQQLYLTGTGGSVVPNYDINYLGTDIYFGPLNSNYNVWNGDFAIISGYNNLSLSLGRRLQTTLGSLMYEVSFGSRIPPEVGKIQSQSTSGNILAYASAAILADPRVYKITNATVSLDIYGAVVYNGVVIPNGIGTTSSIVNEVLQPIG